MRLRHEPGYDRRKAYNERLRAKGLTTKGQPFTGRPRFGNWLTGGMSGFAHLIPAGPARDTIEEWLDLGIPVSFYLQMGKTTDGSVWMIRVGDRELSVEEYLLLFDDEH